MKKTNWKVVFTAFAIGVLSALQVGRIAPVADEIRTDLFLNLSTLGWAVSLITFASALLGVPAGYWISRQGPRTALIAGTFLLAACVAFSTFATSAGLLLLGRAMEGFGYLAVAVAAPTLISTQVTERDRPRALALWGTFFAFGISIAAIAAGNVSELLGWRGWFAVNVALIVLAGVGAAIIIPRDLAVPSPRSQSNKSARMPAPAWLLGAAFLGIVFLQLALLSMLPTYFVDNYQMGLPAAGSTTGLVALASIGGSFAFGALYSRISEATLMHCSTLLLAVSAGPLFVLDLGIQEFVAMTICAVFAVGALMAYTFSAVPKHVGQESKIGPANGVITQVGSIGALTGPPIFGAMVMAYGWNTLSFIIVGSVLCFYIFALAANTFANTLRLSSQLD